MIKRVKRLKAVFGILGGCAFLVFFITAGTVEGARMSSMMLGLLLGMVLMGISYFGLRYCDDYLVRERCRRLHKLASQGGWPKNAA